jgi:hypothetical protein
VPADRVRFPVKVIIPLLFVTAPLEVNDEQRNVPELMVSDLPGETETAPTIFVIDVTVTSWPIVTVCPALGAPDGVHVFDVAQSPFVRDVF